MAASRQLLLLRHAKSSWEDPLLADHDRPLAPRGRKAAGLIGEHLRHDRVRVSRVLCSSARRARETLELLAIPGEAQIESTLYGASGEQLLERLRLVPDEVESVLLIGHNPAIQDLAASLVRGGGGLAERKFPTAALATLKLDGPWRALERDHAELAALVTPRTLKRPGG